MTLTADQTPAEEAQRLQSEASDARIAAYEAEQEAANKIIQFRPRG